MVIIPPKQIKKVYGLPEDVVDMRDTANATIQAKYTIWDQNIVTKPFQVNVIRNQMTRNLDVLTHIIATELEAAFERSWGSGNGWRKVRVWETCMELISKASNAAFCDAPLCKSRILMPRLVAS